MQKCNLWKKGKDIDGIFHQMKVVKLSHSMLMLANSVGGRKFSSDKLPNLADFDITLVNSNICEKSITDDIPAGLPIQFIKLQVQTI